MTEQDYLKTLLFEQISNSSRHGYGHGRVAKAQAHKSLPTGELVHVIAFEDGGPDVYFIYDREGKQNMLTKSFDEFYERLQTFTAQ